MEPSQERPTLADRLVGLRQWFASIDFRYWYAVALVLAAVGVVLELVRGGDRLTVVALFASILALVCCVQCLLQEQRRLQELAAHDGLTGLKNRRAFDEQFAQLWGQARQERRMLSLLLIDVDFFKNYNDSKGHMAGDRALQCIASVVQGLIRHPLGLAARIGGEELAVVMPEGSCDNAVELAGRIHAAIHRLGLGWVESDQARLLTISTGVAHLNPVQGATPAAMLELADRALYAAKRAGRSRIAVFDTDKAVEAKIFEPLR